MMAIHLMIFFLLQLATSHKQNGKHVLTTPFGLRYAVQNYTMHHHLESRYGEMIPMTLGINLTSDKFAAMLTPALWKAGKLLLRDTTQGNN